jgi:hypothetical protein
MKFHITGFQASYFRRFGYQLVDSVALFVDDGRSSFRCSASVSRPSSKSVTDALVEQRGFKIVCYWVQEDQAQALAFVHRSDPACLRPLLRSPGEELRCPGQAALCMF